MHLKEAIQKNPLRAGLSWITPGGQAGQRVTSSDDVPSVDEELYQGKYRYSYRHISPNRQTRRALGLSRRRPRRMRLARLSGSATL